MVSHTHSVQIVMTAQSEFLFLVEHQEIILTLPIPMHGQVQITLHQQMRIKTLTLPLEHML